MPVLQGHNIGHQFENGDWLFKSLSFTMNHPRVGLVGRNGAGKSLLASIMTGELVPSTGTISKPTTFDVYRQHAKEAIPNGLTIAEFLGKSSLLEALEAVEKGDCTPQLFEIIGDDWGARTELNQQLINMGLPPEPKQACCSLSGGQLARLQLWKLLQSDAELLILDEPSNHLDEQGKGWLIDTMKTFNGAILLISHDRQLLREVGEIWELSDLGLRSFGGNVDVYLEQNRAEQQAVERRLAEVAKQKKHLEKQAQLNREKAEQRAAKGNKMRRDGSQPKILLDAMKNKATAKISNRLKNEQLRMGHLNDQSQDLKERQKKLARQTLHMQGELSKSRRVVNLVNAELPFTKSQPFNLAIGANEKVRLKGQNGSGKSTLLKVLLGEHTLINGELSVNTPLFYLDQHFGLIHPEWTMLENLTRQCEGLAESEARTLLAGIGFRRDSVFHHGKVLSGSEKMKLAMLIVSHQACHPLLLLDEPDNHLDMESKGILGEALSSYQGGFILVSHDDEFAQGSGLNRSIHLN